MIRELLRRELRNARGTLLALSLAVAFVDLLVLGNHRVRGGDMSAFDPMAQAGVPCLWLAALALARRLLSHERASRGRRFLEGLPVPRGAVAGVKLATGFAAVALLAGAQVLLFAALGRPAPDAHLGLLVLARCVLVALYATGLAFGAASLGRYYTPGLTAVGVAQLTASVMGWDAPARGATALVAAGFTVDRGALPALPVAAALAGAAAGAAFTAWMWRARSGTLSADLHAPMSHAEGMRWAAGFLVVMSLAQADHDLAARYDLPDARPHREGDLSLTVAGLDPAAEAALVAHAMPALRALRRWTGRAPRAFVVARADLAPGAVRALEPAADVALVAVNPAPPGLAPERLAAAVVQAAALVATRGHVRREDTAWVLDGVGLTAVGLDARDESLARRHAASLRASDLAAWRAWRERAGERGAERVAASLLAEVARWRGAAALDALLRAALARPLSASAPAAWWAPDMADAWRAAGVDPAALVARWQAHASAGGAQPTGALDVRRASPLTRALTLRLTGDPFADDALVAGEVWRARGDDAAAEHGLDLADDGASSAWRRVETAAAWRRGVAVEGAFVAGATVLWRLRARDDDTATGRAVLP